MAPNKLECMQCICASRWITRDYFSRSVGRNGTPIWIFFNSSTSLSQNKAIPKITNYYEQVLPTSKNSTFQQHFRLCRPGAEYLLSVIGPRLVSPGVNGRPPVPPEKKDLVMLTYISGSVSLRPLSTTFGSEKSTCSIIYREVYKQL